MTYREVELLAVGAGPSNLALAVAVEELAPADLARNSLLVERADAVRWQPGLLLPWARSQVSFLKDLVTRRDPRSRFSFLNYLHDVGRLDDFINMSSFTPYRAEISDYLGWVARSLTRVRVELGRECVAITPRRDAKGELVGWATRMADGSVIGSRYLVVGAGRDVHIPAEFRDLPAELVVHSTRYRPAMDQLGGKPPARVVVLGGAQSAAEMFRALDDDLPGSEVTWLMRSIGLNAYETSKFTNELYFPSFVDKYFAALPAGREQVLREMHRTNYSGVAPALLESLYEDRYLDRLSGSQRKRMITMVDVTSARQVGQEIELELTDRRTGTVSELRCDLVLLGTGFAGRMPTLVRGLCAELGLDRITVGRRYRLELGERTQAACYLQGVNEATHGIADSLLSVLADRAGDTLADILDHRDAPATNGQSATAANGHLPLTSLAHPDGGTRVH